MLNQLQTVYCDSYSLPNENILDWFKFNAFADDLISNLAGQEVIVSESTENIVSKGENAAYQHFLLLTQGLQRNSSLAWLKLWTYGKEFNDKAFYSSLGIRPTGSLL